MYRHSLALPDEFRRKHPDITAVTLVIPEVITIDHVGTSLKEDFYRMMQVHIQNTRPKEEELPFDEIDAILSRELTDLLGTQITINLFHFFSDRREDGEDIWAYTCDPMLTEELNKKIRPRQVATRNGTIVPHWWQHLEFDHLLDLAVNDEFRDIMPSAVLGWKQRKEIPTNRRKLYQQLPRYCGWLLPAEYETVQLIPLLDDFYPAVLTDIIVAYL